MIAALYIRVSTAEQTKGYSLEAQEDLLRRYAKEHNMPVYKLYADVGKSANKALSRRQALLQMVNDAEHKRFSCILFKDITRWSRRSADYFAIQDRLDKCGCSWIAVEQPYLETITPTGRFQVSVMLGTAQLESENTSQRIRFVRDQLVKNGIVPYSSRLAPLGYKVEMRENVRRLVKDPEQSEMVSDMFDHLIKYRNASETRRYISERYGRDIDRVMFSRIMHNSVYRGEYRGVKNFCEPYITERDAETLSAWSNNFRKARYSDNYIFRGILRCAKCGYAMQANYVPNQTKEDRVYYRCPTCFVLHKCDQNKSVRQDRLEQIMLSDIRPAFDVYKYTVTVEKHKQNSSKRIERLQAKLKRLTEVYIDGSIDKDTYDMRRASIRAEIADLEVDPINDTTAIENLLNQPWERLYERLDPVGRGAFWRSMVKKILFDGENVKIEFV